VRVRQAVCCEGTQPQAQGLLVSSRCLRLHGLQARDERETYRRNTRGIQADYRRITGGYGDAGVEAWGVPLSDPGHHGKICPEGREVGSRREGRGALTLAAERLLKDGGPAVGCNHRPHQRSLASVRYMSLMLRQLASRDCIDQIAFAEGWPIQPIGLIEYHFMRFGAALRPLRRT